MTKEEILAKHIDLSLPNTVNNSKFWIVLAMDEFAKQECIKFRKWFADESKKLGFINDVINWHNKLTAEELYELYLKSKDK